MGENEVDLPQEFSWLMEEYEEFDPTDPDRPPENLLEVDQCIQLAKLKLNTHFGYSFPSDEKIENKTNVVKSSNSVLGLESLGDGALFYPCAALDTKLVAEVFSDLVDSIYLCDVHRPRGLGFIRSGVSKTTIPNHFGDYFWVPHVGRVFQETRSEILTFPRVLGDALAPVNYCVGDAVHFFLQSMGSISVFFYRSDSPIPDGEGGSGVLWFGPVLLDLVLQRVVNGGILCTDFSNSYGFLAERLKDLVVGEKLQYRDFTLIRLEPATISTKLSSLTIVQVLRT